MTFTNAAITQTQGLTSGAAVQQTFGLQPAIFQSTSPFTNVTFITPAVVPPISNAQSNFKIVLTNQLAAQVGKLFQDLFPIATNPNDVNAYITDQDILYNNKSELLNDVQQIKTTILYINQLTLPADHIPTNIPVPVDGNAFENAGLVNPIIVLVNNLWFDVNQNAFAAAQDDYAILREALKPYFNL